MQVDRCELRDLLILLLQALRRMEEELLAYQILVRWLRRVPELREELDKLLEEARSTPTLREHLRRKYDIPMERIAERVLKELES